MLEFENSPEMLALKDVLREFFSGIIENAVGAFRGFGEWINDLRLNMPPLLKLFGNTKVNLFILIAFIVFVVFLNLKAYVLFAADKRYAQEAADEEDDEWERVPEWRLLTNIWLGGAIGAMIAMYRLRHKTRHTIFKISVWICAFLDLLLFSAVVGFLGFWTFF